MAKKKCRDKGTKVEAKEEEMNKKVEEEERIQRKKEYSGYSHHDCGRPYLKYKTWLPATKSLTHLHYV